MRFIDIGKYCLGHTDRSATSYAIVIILAAFVVCYSDTVSGALPVLCGTLENHYGPYDYRNPNTRRESLDVVDSNHFDRNVENLRPHSKCQIRTTCTSVAADIDYTLRAFPNHHRALVAMARYHLRGMDKIDRQMRYSATCYFLRAIEFAPDDPTVRMIHAYYLSKSNDLQGARVEYEEALSLAPDSAEVNYNAGLFFLDLNEVGRARECAKRAYDLGHPLPGLRDRLKAKGIDLDD